MENRDKTAECVEIAAVKLGNHTHAADDIDWRVSQIDCHWRWEVVNHYPRFLKCRDGAVASHIGHSVEPYSLSSVEIPLSPSSVNIDGGQLL